MQYVKKTVALVCLSFVSVYGMDDKKNESKPLHQLSFMQSSCVSGVTGGAEAFAGRPLDFLKTMKMLKKPIPSNPLRWYSGLSVHLLGIVPTTVFQGQAESLFSKVCDDKTTSAGLAGVASALVCCPVERLILEKQTSTQTSRELLQRFSGTNGMRNLYKGAPAMAGRELLFTVGYMNSVKTVQSKVSEHVDNPYAQSAAAAIACGVPLALMSHPCETVRVWQQTDKGKSAADVLKKMYYSNEGLSKNLFRGGAYRTMRYCLALGVMSNTHQKTSQFFSKEIVKK